MQKIYQLTALAVLMLNLSGCSTIVSAKPELDSSLTEPCGDLPAIDIKVGDDIRLAWTKSRALDVKIHDDCKNRHKELVKAVN